MVIVPSPAFIKLNIVDGGPFKEVKAPVEFESILNVKGGVPPLALKSPNPSDPLHEDYENLAV